MSSSNMWKVTCRDCKRRVDGGTVVLVRRFGGGSYNRPGRYYLGQTCVDCVESAVLYIAVRDGEFETFHLAARYRCDSLLWGLAELVHRGVSDVDQKRWKELYPGGTFTAFDEFYAALTTRVQRDLDALTAR